MNSDFRDLLKIFNEENVEYLIVGAHAVIYYAEPRYTKDIDIWVSPSSVNAARVFRALQRFGAPLSGITELDFAESDVVYQMGFPPNRIDVMTGIDGLTFPEAWPNRTETSYSGVPMYLLARADLIRNKLASARPQDLLDVQRLSEKP